MTLIDAGGERDALLIPFPLHRVSASAPSSGNHEAIVHIFTSGVALSESMEPDQHASLESQDPKSEASPRQARKARNVSLHALAGRGQSRHEIEKRLRSRELSEEVVATEIEALEEAGLIDDETLAADLVDKYAVRGGLGRRAVEDKLRSRKLSAQVINEALSVLSHEGEKEAVRELALTKIRSLESVAPDVAKRRLQGFLLRKGYSPSDVYPLVSELLG